MPHLAVPGATLYWEADGHASHPALLLIHAGIASLRMWDPLVGALAATHHVIRFDTRGFGRTEQEDVGYSNRADALAVLDHLGVTRAAVVGASRGGTIAIDMALESPERITGLVTIGSGPSGFPEQELTPREDAMVAAIDEAEEAHDWRSAARLETVFWGVGPLREENDLDPTFLRVAYELGAANIRHADETASPLPIDPPAYGRLADIAVPALITVGEYDISPTLQQHRYLADNLPHATSAIFHDAAHLPSVERAEEFLHVLEHWLDDHGL